MFSFLKHLAAGLLTGATFFTAQAAPPVPPADLTVLASQGQSFSLLLDGRLLTRIATQQVHVGWLTPGRHWADLSVFTPYGPPMHFRTTVWLQPGLDSRYMVVSTPYGPNLQSLGAVAASSAGYGPYGAPGSYPAPQGSYPAPQGGYGQPRSYPAPQGGYGQPQNYPAPQGGYGQPVPNGNAPGSYGGPGSYGTDPNDSYPNGGTYNGPAQPRAGYPAPQGSYPAPQGGYGQPQGGYSQPQGPTTYPAPQGGYSPNAQDPNEQDPNSPDPNNQPNAYPDAAGGYLTPMPAEEVQGLAQELRQQPSDEARLDLAQQALANSSLQSQELADLLRTFSREHGRVELAKFGYAHVSDQANFGRVYSALRDPASVEEVRQALGLQRTY